MEKIRIVDGKIISQQGNDLSVSPPIAETDPLLEELKDFSLDLTQFKRSPKRRKKRKAPEAAAIQDFRSIDGILIPKDTPYLPAGYASDALGEKKEGICPYLLQNDIQDYAMFMDYLKNSGKQERTRYDYTVSLRKWKKELETLGGELKVEHLNTILRKVSIPRAYNLLIALRSYAKYRNLRGDKVLLILLSSSSKLFHPVKEPKSEETESLSDKEARHYKKLAKDLCKEDNKAGIWIGLSLLGVTPGNLAAVEFPDKSHIRFLYRRNEQICKIDTWLYNACHRIDGWRLGRRGIHHGVSKYETTPHALNRFAVRSK